MNEKFYEINDNVKIAFHVPKILLNLMIEAKIDFFDLIEILREGV